MLGALLVVVAASLAWSVHQTVASPTTAYFSTFTRAWELGLGALVALVPASAVRRLSPRILEGLALTGAVSVVAACLLISSTTPFPGIAAALPVGGTAHQAGTCRFGTDPATSVLDLDCKAHELDNLYLTDASFFPSIGAVNPTLTIIANALRVADHLKGRLGA